MNLRQRKHSLSLTSRKQYSCFERCEQDGRYFRVYFWVDVQVLFLYIFGKARRIWCSGLHRYILNHVYRSLGSNCSILRALMVTELDMASVQQSYFSDQLPTSQPPEGTQAAASEDKCFHFALIKLQCKMLFLVTQVKLLFKKTHVDPQATDSNAMKPGLSCD